MAARGRNYIVGLAEDVVSGNSVTPGFAAAVTAAYTALITATGAGPWLWVVVSRYSNGAPRSQGLAQAVNAALLTDTNIDSQRRRLSGRGA